MQKNQEDKVFSPFKLLVHDRIRKLFENKSKVTSDDLLQIYPITLELGPSGRCNNSCDFCMHGKYYENGEIMPFSMYERLINEVSSYDSIRRPRGMIFSSSGEPLLNPRIIDFIEYTKEKGIDVALISNGTALGKKDLINSIVKNVSWIRISLNSGSPETRAKIHGVRIEDYANVLESLSQLSSRKKEMGSKCHTGAQIVVTEENYLEMDQACRDVKNTGIDYFQIKPVVFHPEDGRPQLSSDFWKTVLEEAEKAKQKYEDENFKVFVKYEQFFSIMKPDYDKSAYNVCLAMFFPIFEADGKVYHCSQTRGLASQELGDLKKQTFQEIWESEKRKEVVRSIDIKKCQPVCRCHVNNKLLNQLVDQGYTPDLKMKLENLLEKEGDCAPSFV